ncbi:DDE-type integrase/transposase/recombinase [Streptomyces sp. NPDC053720]|uniref:DDE-type integrase/transposase/recombinase n=1 Tax=Streptomyces sp. NPDC053720 TaxID=3154855 RepID=UPI00343A1D43
MEELMVQRGVTVSHETVRRWCLKFDHAYTSGLRRRRPRPGDKWHLDKVFIKINSEKKYLRGRSTSTAMSLTSPVRTGGTKAAAGRFFRRLMTKTGRVPRVVVTDKLRSYGAAHRDVVGPVVVGPVVGLRRPQVEGGRRDAGYCIVRGA